MAHFHFASSDLISITLVITIIVIVVIVSNVFFRQRFITDREREENAHLLWTWLLVAITIIIVITLLAGSHYDGNHCHDHRDEHGGPEYNARSENGAFDRLRQRVTGLKSSKTAAAVSPQASAQPNGFDHFQQQQQARFRANAQVRAQQNQ